MMTNGGRRHIPTVRPLQSCRRRISIFCWATTDPLSSRSSTNRLLIIMSLLSHRFPRRGNCRLREPQSHFPFSFLFCTSKHKRHDKGNTFFSFCFGLRVTHKKGKRPRDWCAERSAWLNGNDRPRDDDEKAVMTYINSQEIGFWLMLAVWRCVRWESSARAQQCPIVSFPPLTQLESLFPKSCVRLFCCCCCCHISALIAAASPMDWFPVGRPKQCAPLSAVIDSVRWTQQLCWLCAQTRFVITCKHIRSTIPLP